MSVWAINTPIKPSKKQQIVVCVFHVLALLAIALAYIPIWAKIASTFVLLCLCWMSWRPLSLQVPSSIIALSIDDEHWLISLKNGQRLRVQLHTWAVWRYLMVLDFQAKDIKGNYRVLIWPDSISAADYRRLQVRLRLAGTERKLRLLEEV